MSDDTPKVSGELLDAMREAEARVIEARPPRKEHRDALEEQLVARANQKQRAKIIAFPTSPETLAAATIAAAAAALLLAWIGFGDILRGSAPEASTHEPNAAAMRHDLHNNTPGCDATDSGARVVIAPDCVWRWERASAELAPLNAPLEVAHVDGAMRIYRGEVRVEVDPSRARDEPVRVEVGAGTIEVIGTAFTIKQRGEARGEVTLHRGKITFAHAGGERVEVTPGETVVYGEPVARDEPEDRELAANQTSTPTPFEPDTRREEIEAREASARSKAREAKRARVEREDAPKARALTDAQKRERAKLDAKELRDVRHLRRLGKHDDALRKLADLEKQTASSYTREVISYEIGDIHISRANTARACAQWSRHIKRFPKGRYASRVRESMAREGCAR